MNRIILSAALYSLALGGVVEAGNYNNTRSNRSSIAGPGVTTQWNSLSGVLLDVADFDDDGFGGPPASISLDPNPGADFVPLGLLVELAGREVPIHVFAVNDRPSAGSTLDIWSEEFGGSGMNLARLSDSVSFGPSGFNADTAADTMITDVGTSVAVSSDRILLRAATASTFAIDLDISSTFDLDLLQTQDAFTGVTVNWSFGIDGGAGQTVLESGTSAVELDMFSGLNPNGVTDISVIGPGGIPEFDLSAGTDYFVNVDVVVYSIIVPAPGAITPIAIAGFIATRRRRGSK